MCVSFLKKPSAKKWFSFHENLCTLYIHSSPSGLSEKAETQKKDTEGVIPVSLASTRHAIKTVMNHTLLYKTLLSEEKSNFLCLR